MSKDSLHAFLGHFEDAFLIHTVSLFSTSERQRMVNPRKAYPIDHGLISIYERAGRDNLGHTLESAVYIELRRRSCEVHYFRTKEGNEVDFHAMDAMGQVSFIQVCANADDPATLNRELRSLIQAKAEILHARAQCILLEPLHPISDIPAGVEIISAIEWFLQE